jgi:hypothetical protein
MSVLKPPPKLIRNATIQVRVEEEVDLKLRKYAEFIDATPAFVVAESLKLLFNKDAEFREWLNKDTGQSPARAPERAAQPEAPQAKSNVRTMFDELPQKAVGK